MFFCKSIPGSISTSFKSLAESLWKRFLALFFTISHIAFNLAQYIYFYYAHQVFTENRFYAGQIVQSIPFEGTTTEFYQHRFYTVRTKFCNVANDGIASVVARHWCVLFTRIFMNKADKVAVDTGAKCPIFFN